MTTPRGLRILIAGSGRLGYAAITPLFDSPHTIVGLVQNARKVPRWKQYLLPWHHRYFNLAPSALREIVRRGLPVCWLDTQDESELETLRALKPDLIITCGFSIILSQALIELPRIGCINIHTALLPKHRGATPCAHVILDADPESGVTIHVTSPEIDGGPILSQERFPTEPDDTSMDIYWASCALTESMILDTVNEIAQHQFSRAIPQLISETNYDPRFDHDQARIHWKQPAETIARLVRAAYIYTPAYFEFRGEPVQLRESTPTCTEHNVYPGTILCIHPHLEIATGNGTLILHHPYTQTRKTSSWPHWTTRLKIGMTLD